MSSPKNESLLAELLSIIGTNELPPATEEEINEILKRGIPLVLKEQLGLIISAGQERNKAWMIKEWLDRAGLVPVQKVAIAQKIQLDEKTLKVLAAIAAEDDPDSELCETVVGLEEGRPGGDPPQPAAEGSEIPLLPEQGDPGISGPDAGLPPADVPVRPGPDDPPEVGGAPEGPFEKHSLLSRQADPSNNPGA